MARLCGPYHFRVTIPFRPDDPLPKNAQAALWVLGALVLVFGAIVEMRSAFLHRRMTDADDFFRAAWAIRTGSDIYEITDTNGWHYNYPPLFALLLTPLANPPPGADRKGFLPYEISVAIWYALSIAFLAVAAHWLASAFERAVPRLRSRRHGRQWWLMRFLPVAVCLISVGRTLSRGQCNTLVLVLFCGMIALLLSGRRALAGGCLAGAICIKIWPAFLILYPVYRRDFRFIGGCVAGVILGLLVIPSLALGSVKTMAQLQHYAQVTLLPGLGIGEDRSRADELTTATATDSESFVSVLHAISFPNADTRPQDALPWERATHWFIAAMLTAMTFWAAKSTRGDVLGEAILLGALMVLMLPISPVCHGHYFIFALPLVSALAAEAWERCGEIGAGLATLFVAHFALHLISTLPAFAWAKEFGVPLVATLALWIAALVVLRKRAAAFAIAPAPALEVAA